MRIDSLVGFYLYTGCQFQESQMPRRHILMLWIVLVSESALAQHPSSLFFACGNKEHTPPHSAKDLDEAKAMTKRLGCRAWKGTHALTGNNRRRRDANSGSQVTLQNSGFWKANRMN